MDIQALFLRRFFANRALSQGLISMGQFTRIEADARAAEQSLKQEARAHAERIKATLGRQARVLSRR